MKKPEKYEDNLLVKGRNEPCTMMYVIETISINATVLLFTFEYAQPSA